METPLDPATLDTGTLALFAGLALADAALATISAAGHPDLRFAHGFIVQHLVEGPITVSEIAGRMGVSQQAASKSLKQLADLGYVAIDADPVDRRVRNASLTARGRDAITTAREARATLEKQLEFTFGERRLGDARAVLLDILESHGGTDAIRGRRVRFG